MRPRRAVLRGAVLLLLVTAGACGAEPPGRTGAPPVSPTVSPADPTASPMSPAGPTGPATAVPPAPRRLTARDDGRTYATSVGARLSLSLADHYGSGGLEVDGAAVDLSEDVSDAPTGQRTWELRPRVAGVAVVRLGSFSVELQVAPG